MPDYHVGVMNHEKTVLVILCQDHEVVILCDDNNFSKWITKIFCDHVDINLKKKEGKKKKNPMAFQPSVSSLQSWQQIVGHRFRSVVTLFGYKHRVKR